MLNIVVGAKRVPKGYNTIVDTRAEFSLRKRPEWFEDAFVKKFLKVVDGSEVLFEEAIKDKFGHGISTEMISSGCKTLCIIYFDKDKKVYYNGSMLGDNCVPFLMEMAEKRDINIFLRHVMEFITEDGVDYFKTGLIYMDGKQILDEEQYISLIYSYENDVY